MATRLELQALLEELLGSDKVYFQEPPSLLMSYPCIVYKRERIDIKHANNFPYKKENRYALTVIDKNPDSLIPDKVSSLPKVSYSRFFTANNLNHTVFYLYF